MADATAFTESSAYTLMKEGWRTISDLMAGPKAIRDAGTRYLPQYSAEGPAEYQRRLAAAPQRPEFMDILQSLSAKPFGKEVALKDGGSARIKDLVEDIDARGNNLTVFARSVFRGGIAKGMHGILVDFPTMSPNLTLADEKAAGARPYWVSIRAEDIIALYTTFVGGREIIAHVRLRESVTRRDGFGEVTVDRVRVLEPGRWELWENDGKGATGRISKIGEGVVTLKEVPLALFWTGERVGEHQVRPPLESLADMQIELYRALARQDEILTYAGSPMLCAQGIAAPKDPNAEPLQIGPKRILFAPPGVDGKTTGWSYIQPDAANLKEIRESVGSVVQDLRRLGMQPLTQRSGGVTATATSVEAAKAHSTVEAWALALKDCLEVALVFTSQWLQEADSVEVEIDTDFSVEAYAQAPLDALHKARAARDISLRTYWNGLRRFDVLAPDFDPDGEELAVAEELQGLEPDDPAGENSQAGQNADIAA